MTQIHVLDQQTDKILDVTTDFWGDNHYESLKQEETFSFIVSAQSRIAPHLTKRNRIVIPVDDGFFREFIIEEAHQIDSDKEVYALSSYIELKKEEPIAPITLTGATINTAIDHILKDTGWERGVTDFSGQQTIEFDDYINPYDALRKLTNVDNFDLELRFRIEMNGNKIIRLVDMIERVGSFRGKEIVSGKDLISAKRTEMTDQVVTALYVIGPEREDGNRYVEIVENEEARQAWGRKRDGTARHLWDIHIPQTEDADMTRTRLRQLGNMELNKRVSSAIQWEIEGVDLEKVFGREHEKVRLGDGANVKVTEYNPPIYLESRIITREGSIRKKAPKTYTLGEFIERTEEDVHAMWKLLEKQISKKIGEAQLVQYAEKIIPEQDIAPNPQEHPKWIDTSEPTPQLKLYDFEAEKWTAVKGEKGDPGKNGVHIGPNPPEDPLVDRTWFKVDAKGSLISLNRWTPSGWQESKMDAEILTGEIDLAKTMIKNANSTVFTDVNGNVYYVDPDNPKFVVKITSKGIAIGTNGVNGDFNTVMTGGGIIADFVNAGHMSFDRLQGGSAVLGGSGNFGSLEVLADDDSTIFRANKDGLVDAAGRELVGKGGVLSQLTFVSSGGINGWQQAGWWGEGTISEQRAYIYGYIPPNFEIESATLYTYSRPLRFRGWSGISDGYYHCPYIHLITYNDYRDAYLDFPAQSEYTNMYRTGTEQILSGASWGGSWHPSGSKDQVITASVTNRLQGGYPFVFGIKTTAPFAQTNKSLILFQLSVTGYKK